MLDHLRWTNSILLLRCNDSKTQHILGCFSFNLWTFNSFEITRCVPNIMLFSIISHWLFPIYIWFLQLALCWQSSKTNSSQELQCTRFSCQCWLTKHQYSRLSNKILAVDSNVLLHSRQIKSTPFVMHDSNKFQHTLNKNLWFAVAYYQLASLILKLKVTHQVRIFDYRKSCLITSSIVFFEHIVPFCHTPVLWTLSFVQWQLIFNWL